MKLVLHPSTQELVTGFIDKPSHGLMLEGARGTGKGALSTSIAAQILTIGSKELLKYPFFLRLTPTNNTISIDTIRNAQGFMHLKTLGKSQALRRILIIEDAEAMTLEAQNAFLKLLEEPPEDTLIIMTVTHQSSMLPTIYSRVQQIHISTPIKQGLVEYFKTSGYKLSDIEKAYHMSDGRAGLMATLLSDETNHPLVGQIAQAKVLLSQSSFERLTKVDQLTKQRDETELLIDALQLVSHAALILAIKQGRVATIKRWHNTLKRLTEIQDAYSSYPNLKLLLTNLFINV
jgi:DNA polymerase-3 subunit delta'